VDEGFIKFNGILPFCALPLYRTKKVRSVEPGFESKPGSLLLAD
jgi:hypothetical protein